MVIFHSYVNVYQRVYGITWDYFASTKSMDWFSRENFNRKAPFFNGKIYMVSGSDFPVNQSIDKKIQNSVSSMIWEVP